MKKLLTKSIFMLLAMSLLSSCQIEKRQYVKGFFVSNPASEHSSRSESNQLTDTYIDNVDSVQGADVAATQQELILAPDVTNDSLQTENFSKETVFTKSISNIESGLSPAFKHLLLRKTSLLTIIPAQYGSKKLHPFAILGLGLLGLSIVLFLLYSNFLWTISNIFGFLSILFYILSIVTLFIARRKTLENLDKWSGITLINLFFYIEIISLTIALIGLLIGLYLVF